MRYLHLFFSVTFCMSLSFATAQSESSDRSVWVESRISSMTLTQKISQSLIVTVDLNWEKSKISETLDFIRLNSPGGVYIKGGTIERARKVISAIRGQSLVPVYVSTEASYGLAESVFEKRSFPYPLTVASADSLELTGRIGGLIGEECRRIGVNLNLTHTANVYANPMNSSGYMLSFGENPRNVSKHSEAYLKAFGEKSVVFAPMDFPGAGDLDKLNGQNICQNAKIHIEAIDLMPFRSLISAGVNLIGMSNAQYPALDSTDNPATRSEVIINGLLRKTLGFKGVVVSASLQELAEGMATEAYLAGCDLLLSPRDPEFTIEDILRKIQDGQMSESEVDDKLRRILNHKYDHIVKARKNSKVEYNLEWTVKTVFENAQTVLKNDGVLPIQRFDQRIALVSIGSHVDPLWSSVSRSADIDCFHAYSVDEAIERYSELADNYDILITALHTNSFNSEGRHIRNLNTWAHKLARLRSVLLINGDVRSIRELDELPFNAVLVSFENHPFALDRMGELVMGCRGSSSKLSVTLSEKYKRGEGHELPWSGRLSSSDPSVLGISSKKLNEIDEIVLKGIKNKAFPGCQVLVAVDGKVIYRKNFGYQTYDSILPVKHNTIYDVASVTKVVSSTASVMRLQSQGMFDLDSSLGNYLDLVDSTAYESMVIREMMAHQAGLYPWIPFYTKTMVNGVHDTTVYSAHRTNRFSSRVSTNLWIDPSYEGVMYQKILKTSLGKKRYKYSDLGYYFLKRIIEDKSGFGQDEYVNTTFYKPMGLKTIGYNPLERFSLDRIPPTEDDKIFRKELVHGFVHDQGTAMLGGVGGHAGIFSNSWDLAAVMQMFLNGGKYGAEFISKEVIDEFTSCQFCPTNRRGAGFDKPVRSLNGGPTCGLVSLDSYGHSGFTGTFVWADPKYKINYVFLSNRVYPDAENWKIVSMNIRSDIQRVIYEAVLQGSHSH